VFFVALVAAHQGVQYFTALTPAQKAEAVHKGLQAAADQQRPNLPKRRTTRPC